MVRPGDSRAQAIDLDAPRRSMRILSKLISTEAVGKRAEGVKVEAREQTRLLRPRRLESAGGKVEYMCEQDLMYVEFAIKHFVDEGPQWPSFRSSISCLFMTALGRTMYKFSDHGKTYAAVLLNNRKWTSALGWCRHFLDLVDALYLKHSPEAFNGWRQHWDVMFAGWYQQIKACEALPGAPLEIDYWEPFKSVLPDPRPEC
ncbi:hypothetical protein T492DRAFT_863194 [Pavlovales sp. CCMP2436]|nr:hypothetical protein T492DRAFT_863194 [Pavlovales sp. CCMP2436]